MRVRVRFAPSPTGNPHVGNIRTALFTYLFARKNNGRFILRIEDTDKTREVEGSSKVMEESLKWLGLNFDEGPIFQSGRLNIYKEHVDKLINGSIAYKKDGAIYFKVQTNGKTSWIDLVGNKEIVFDNSTQEDFVILRSDGFPTYHLASVVDDHLMNITHVTRGEDWISSTPRHIMLFQSFNWQLPQFAHFPNILALDRSKLSKRYGAVGVLDFKKDGYLPDALINFLALLGWTPPSGKEIISIKEMIAEFDLKDINAAPAVFNIHKLEWMNGEYIRSMSSDELTKRLQEFLVDHPSKDKIAPVVHLIKERIKKLSDFIPLTHFIWEKPEYDLEVFAKVKIDNKVEVLSRVLEQLQKLPKPWEKEEFEHALTKLAGVLQIQNKEFFQLIRISVSGQLVTPPLFETMKIISEEGSINRIKEVILWLNT